MKRKILKINGKVGELLSEAMRRIYTMGGRQSLNYRFAGLGTPSMYKMGVEAGFFEPTWGETPKVNNWYCLTPLGQKIVKQMKRKKLCPKNCQDISNYIPFNVVVCVEN